MKKSILAILTAFLVTGFLVADSQAHSYRRHRAFRTGSAVVISPQPYCRYYYSSAPMVYLPPPWLPGISVFFPGVNIRIR
ncbi:MAG: hypothetical protein Q7U40_00915 [Desulfatirhabdiaceae bacterium]|nr:hypothetical protein [Desulfatirhabdiaceae bacterium]